VTWRGLNFRPPLLIGFFPLRSTRSLGTGSRAATLDPQPGPLHTADPSRSDARPDAGPRAPWERCTALKDQ